MDEKTTNISNFIQIIDHYEPIIEHCEQEHISAPKSLKEEIVGEFVRKFENKLENFDCPRYRVVEKMMDISKEIVYSIAEEMIK